MTAAAAADNKPKTPRPVHPEVAFAEFVRTSLPATHEYERLLHLRNRKLLALAARPDLDDHRVELMRQRVLAEHAPALDAARAAMEAEHRRPDPTADADPKGDAPARRVRQYRRNRRRDRRRKP